MDWQVWGPGVFTRAAAEHKPILLSIGYAACHWCHVMAHESFEDEATARLMNDNYICVKVDREERPDLDMVYQSALQALEGQGGWPLTMFLTADATPFWGGTYFPPEARWGKPAFREVLSGIARVYRDDPARVRESVAEMTGILRTLSAPLSGAAAIPADLPARAARAILPALDPVHGGFNGAPKFPQLSALQLVWRQFLATGDAKLGDAVTLALDRMSQGGIYYHVGGGYARYATDAVWLVPHFEKMLYDNAQFIDVLTTVWRTTKSALYEARVRETVAWLLREMTTASGALASSFDADSGGEEGTFYVWSEAEIDELLGPRAAPFKAAYEVTAGGNWEGATILNRTARPRLGGAAEETLLAADRDILFTARKMRVAPERDDKALADWNGMTIAALAQAAATFGEPRWLAAAERAFAAVVTDQTAGDRLHHSYCAGDAVRVGFLDDYAHMARAALALFEATGADHYLQRSQSWIAALNDHYWDGSGGGYFIAATDGDPHLLVRPRHAHDNAQPSGNGIAAEVLTRLYYLTGEDGYRQRAEAVLATFGGEATRYPVALATLLNAAGLLATARQIAVIGHRGDPATDALIAAAQQAPSPDRVIVVVAPGADLPPGHPATAKTQAGGKATAYVCQGTTCSLPVTTAAELAQSLRDP